MKREKEGTKAVGEVSTSVVVVSGRMEMSKAQKLDLLQASSERTFSSFGLLFHRLDDLFHVFLDEINVLVHKQVTIWCQKPVGSKDRVF